MFRRFTRRRIYLVDIFLFKMCASYWAFVRKEVLGFSSHACECVYVHIHEFVCVCVYVNVFMCTYMFVCMCMRVRVNVCECVCMNKSVYVHKLRETFSVYFFLQANASASTRTEHTYDRLRL